MIDPFERGKVWFLYGKLEKEFTETTSYVALETVHNTVWSERFGELLTRTGDLVDSFFRYMVNSESLDDKKTVKELREKIQKKRQTEPFWHPDISDFRKTFNPVFDLSSVEVEADYGLTYYGKLQPFKDFEKKAPPWWDSYNKVKHEIFEQIEKKANLENTINALAGLFILNILHKESQQYLSRHTNVLSPEAVFEDEFMKRGMIEWYLRKSFIGVPKGLGYNIIARTQLFTHIFRVDKNFTWKK